MTIYDYMWLMMSTCTTNLLWCLKRLNHWQFSAWYSSHLSPWPWPGWVACALDRSSATLKSPFSSPPWKVENAEMEKLEPIGTGDSRWHVFETWGVQLSDIMILKILTSTKHFGSCLMILMITNCLFCRVDGLVFGVQVRWGITPQIAGEMSALGYER